MVDQKSRWGPRAVVFDFDLTLADSTPAGIECSNHALAAMGFATAEPERVRHTIGLTLPHAFRALTGNADPRLEGAYARHFVDRANEVMVARTEIYPEVPETLVTLRGAGVRIGIVSTKFRYRIEAILAKKRITDAVDVIVGGEDVTQHKPDPEGLLRALSTLRVSPRQAVYVGDHPIDAEVAARAGTPFVAVRTGVSTPDTWRSWSTVAVIANVGELIGLLSGAGGPA